MTTVCNACIAPITPRLVGFRDNTNLTTKTRGKVYSAAFDALEGDCYNAILEVNLF